MFRVIRLVLGVLLVRQVPGWWEKPPEEHTARDDPGVFREPLEFARWWYNKTTHEGWGAFDPRQLNVAGWDGWAWTVFDTIVSCIGWLIFGKS